MTPWALVLCVAIAAGLVLLCGMHAVCQPSMPQVLQLAATIIGGVFGVAHQSLVQRKKFPEETAESEGAVPRMRKNTEGGHF